MFTLSILYDHSKRKPPPNITLNQNALHSHINQRFIHINKQFNHYSPPKNLTHQKKLIHSKNTVHKNPKIFRPFKKLIWIRPFTSAILSISGRRKFQHLQHHLKGEREQTGKNARIQTSTESHTFARARARANAGCACGRVRVKTENTRGRETDTRCLLCGRR